jgi:hypothetical protein
MPSVVRRRERPRWPWATGARRFGCETRPHPTEHRPLRIRQGPSQSLRGPLSVGSGGTGRTTAPLVGRRTFPQLTASCIGICTPPSRPFPGPPPRASGIRRDLDTHAGQPRSPAQSPMLRGATVWGEKEETEPAHRDVRTDRPRVAALARDCWSSSMSIRSVSRSRLRSSSAASSWAAAGRQSRAAIGGCRPGPIPLAASQVVCLPRNRRDHRHRPSWAIMSTATVAASTTTGSWSGAISTP